MITIGSHISSSQGYYAMGVQALTLNANTFAFFTRNPRGSRAKKVSEADVQKFLDFSKEHHFGKIVAHASYTMNPCSAKEELRILAKHMMAEDLNNMEYIPNNYYNFHPGSHVGQGSKTGIELTASLLNDVLTKEQSTTVLIETMSGKGSEIGRSFEEIHEILDMIKLSDKVGVCLDTCHIWDGGYDVVHDFDGVMEHFDSVIGLSYLKAIHLNDSMNELGSHKDRHQKIGQGFIGMEAMKRIVNHPALKGLPFILETPNDDKGWTEEITMIRSWC